MGGIIASRELVRFPLLIAGLCVAGCGQTAEEKYATALTILEQEQRRLKEMEPELDAACELAYNKLCRDGGIVVPDYLEAQKEIAEYSNKVARDNEVFKDANARAVISNVNKSNLEMAQKNLAYAKRLIAKAKTPGTEASKKLDELTKDNPVAQKYRSQRARVEQAMATVEATKPPL